MLLKTVEKEETVTEYVKQEKVVMRKVEEVDEKAMEEIGLHLVRGEFSLKHWEVETNWGERTLTVDLIVGKGCERKLEVTIVEQLSW